MNHKGILDMDKLITIALEGLDKSGKKTQSDLLTNFLKEQGNSVVQTEFHRYDTPTGALIKKFLYEEYDVDQNTIELLMAADKQAQQKWFSELEQLGVKFLIIDRYVGSQLCYSKSNGLDAEWRHSLQSKLRKPDFEILIDVSPEVSMSRKGQHGVNDRYERNFNLLTNVRKNYLEYFSNTESRFVLGDCDSLSVTQIAEIIKSEVQNRFLN
jgi:dTMP kinase